MADIYPVAFLIDKLYDELNMKLKKKSKILLDPPGVTNGNKKTYISNFRKICQQLNRTEQVVQSYFEIELSCKTSIDQNGSLIINGNFKQNGIEKIFSNYIRDFVSCKECSSCDTILFKENRINYISCNRCLSKKAIDLK